MLQDLLSNSLYRSLKVFVLFLLCIHHILPSSASKQRDTREVLHPQALHSGIYRPNTKYNLESYAAAWLVSRERFVGDMAENIQTMSNLEGASLAAIGKTVIMTRDYLDFFVSHSSSMTNELREVLHDKQLQEELMRHMQETIDVFKRKTDTTKKQSSKRFKEHAIAIIPFSTIGASILLDEDSPEKAFHTQMRYLYLTATVWSVYRHFPKIIIGLASDSDMAMVRSLRLPVWKYIQVSPENDDLHLLPKAILNNIAGKLNGTITASFLDEMEWTGVEYVYYTEADQILYARYVIRSVELLEGLKGSAALVPHRMQSLPLPIAFNQSIQETLASIVPTNKMQSLRDVDLITEDFLTPTGSCCDDGRFVFKSCKTWWYRCPDYGSQSYKQWIRIGQSGFAMPTGSEHQARCSYSREKGICPKPAGCKNPLAEKADELCEEIDHVVHIP